MERTANNIPYTWELAGSQGAAFILSPSDNHNTKDIQYAKNWLRHNRDAVCIAIASEEDMDELYRAKIFRHPNCKPLQWFEINADNMKLIRKCRTAGMSIDDYVNTHVIGKEKETTEANKLKFAHRGDITKN